MHAVQSGDGESALQAELVGNRAMEASFWAVVCASEAAFPLLLGASLDRARQIAATVGAEGTQDFVRDIWILQVLGPADRTWMQGMFLGTHCLRNSRCNIRLAEGMKRSKYRQRLNPNPCLRYPTAKGILKTTKCVIDRGSRGRQGVADGTLSVLVEKVRSQPQISGAYKKTAPIRSRESVMEFCAAIERLKVPSSPRNPIRKSKFSLANIDAGGVA